jgi:ABC-type nitrate/sulfonate/bicarbonate transport system ATPase subunit
MQELLLSVWERHHRTVLFVTHDVDVADRIIVISRLPGRILKDLAITLPRPRTYDVLLTSDFMAIKRDVLRLVRQEAMAVAGMGPENVI